MITYFQIYTDIETDIMLRYILRPVPVMCEWGYDHCIYLYYLLTIEYKNKELIFTLLRDK